MKKIVCVLVVMMLLNACTKSDKAVTKDELKTLKDSVSYAYGLLSGKQAKNQKTIELNAEIFAKAFQQGYSDDTTQLFSDDESISILDNYSRSSAAQQTSFVREAAEKNIETAEKFLLENGKRQGVVTTQSGLQYMVVKQGKGVKPKINSADRIRFKYALSVLTSDGKFKKIHSDFDSPNAAAQLMGVDNFIAGFTEAVCMMNAGSRYTVWIHPDLGYGYQNSEDIPAGSLLLFDIEVTEVIPS